jgi:hypothetical protein
MDVKLARLQDTACGAPVARPAFAHRAAPLMLEPGTSRAYHPIPWGLPCCLW